MKHLRSETIGKKFKIREKFRIRTFEAAPAGKHKNKCVKTEIYSKKYEVPLMVLIYNNNFIAITDKTMYCNDKSIAIKNIKKIVGEKLLFIGSIIIEADDSTKISIQSDKNTVQKDAELLNNFVKLLLE